MWTVNVVWPHRAIKLQWGQFALPWVTFFFCLMMAWPLCCWRIPAPFSLLRNELGASIIYSWRICPPISCCKRCSANLIECTSTEWAKVTAHPHELNTYWWSREGSNSLNLNSHWLGVILCSFPILCSCDWPNYLKSFYKTHNFFTHITSTFTQTNSINLQMEEVRS